MFFTGRMPFLPPNQQRQSTEGKSLYQCLLNTLYNNWSLSCNDRLMLAYLTSKRVIPAPVMLFLSLFTTRRYASAVHAVAVCPSVCRSVRPSEAGIVSKPLDESRWFWARRLPFICFTLCCKEIRVSPKIRVLPHWNFVPNSLLRKFCHGKSIALSTQLDDSRACWWHLYDSRRVMTSVSCNPLTPLLWFVVDLLFNVFLQLCSSLQDFDRHSASRDRLR